MMMKYFCYFKYAKSVIAVLLCCALALAADECVKTDYENEYGQPYCLVNDYYLKTLVGGVPTDIEDNSVAGKFDALVKEDTQQENKEDMQQENAEGGFDENP